MRGGRSSVSPHYSDGSHIIPLSLPCWKISRLPWTRTLSPSINTTTSTTAKQKEQLSVFLPFLKKTKKLFQLLCTEAKCLLNRFAQHRGTTWHILNVFIHFFVYKYSSLLLYKHDISYNKTAQTLADSKFLLFSDNHCCRKSVSELRFPKNQGQNTVSNRQTIQTLHSQGLPTVFRSPVFVSANADLTQKCRNTLPYVSIKITPQDGGVQFTYCWCTYHRETWMEKWDSHFVEDFKTFTRKPGSLSHQVLPQSIHQCHWKVNM